MYQHQESDCESSDEEDEIEGLEPASTGGDQNSDSEREVEIDGPTIGGLSRLTLSESDKNTAVAAAANSRLSSSSTRRKVMNTTGTLSLLTSFAIVIVDRKVFLLND
jgi:hypothetical protein